MKFCVGDPYTNVTLCRKHSISLDACPIVRGRWSCRSTDRRQTKL